MYPGRPSGRRPGGQNWLRFASMVDNVLLRDVVVGMVGGGGGDEGGHGGW